MGSEGGIVVVRERRSTVALAFLEVWVALLPSHMAFWWLVMVSGVPLRRDSVRTAVQTLEVVWLPSVDLIRFRTLTPDDLTGRERRARRLGGSPSGDGVTEEGREEGCTDGSLYWREVVVRIQHYMLQVISLVLVTLLKCGEGGLEGRSGKGGKADDAGGPFTNLCSDVGCIIGSRSDETAQIYGDGGYLKAKVSKACLSTLDHHRFHNQDGFFRLREISPYRPCS